MWRRAMLVVMLVGALLGSACATGGPSEEEQLEKSAQFHYDMGAGYFESNEVTHAIRELTRALEINPDHAQAHYLMGIIYMGRRDYRRSVNHFEEVLRVEPSFHFARNNLGSVYLAMERWEDAEQEFLILIDETLYTTPELAHNNLGWAYYNQRRFAEALEHFRMAAFLAPQMCLADNNQGLVYEAMGNETEAARYYRLAIEKCPENYQEPHFNLGKLMQARGDGRAVEHFRRCVQIQPRNDLAERCRQYLSVN
ncbi:tetratricopeptide repeat protein [Lujinxingia vulgaris]|uniref:Tetratricopeptide repeat protein n=2 Tax=Lujinxingia vulgaris TaxID=2600176 RepID=A0A5C6XL46_9DELT|nr:tetratricopeptide repeat protein [Lujinxingia vulgaris]